MKTILPAAPRIWRVKSATKSFRAFDYVEEKPLGYLTGDLIKVVAKALRPHMSEFMKALHSLDMLPYELQEAIEQDLRLRPKTSRGPWFSVAYRPHSSMSYLVSGDTEILLHPFDEPEHD